MKLFFIFPEGSEAKFPTLTVMMFAFKSTGLNGEEEIAGGKGLASCDGVFDPSRLHRDCFGP
jgi:hypothetical protein